MKAPQYFTADFLYTQNDTLVDHALVVEDGVITDVLPVKHLEGKQIHSFPDCAIIPGFVNSHNHSFQSLLKGICDDTDFFTWRDKALYKYSEVITKDELYTGALFAFGEMLKSGVTTVSDFFYLNDQANDNAKAIIQAAKDLGIRITLARTMYDWDGAPKRYRETVDEAVKNTKDLMAAYQNDPMVDVIPAPHSFHGASAEMIEAGVQLARDKNTLWHMHVAEGQYERKMMEEKTGKSPIRLLKHMGILDKRMVGVHCVWLDDEEITMMGSAYAGISYNPSSNMFLGDGITRIKELLEADVCISLGTDGGCSNNRASIIEEMRMTNLLQKVKHCDANVLSAEAAFLMGTVNGGRNLGQKLGKLSMGYAADFTVVDLTDLSMQPRGHFVKHIVYSSQPSAIKAVYVAGNCVMESGKLQKFDEEEIIRRIEKTMAHWSIPAVAGVK